MNKIEYDLIEILKRLKNDYGVFQIKAEFENEGSRQVELMRLKDIISKVDLPLILKIGGCEAVSDMYEALSIGAKGIIAPMVETSFATSKFLDAVEKFIAPDNRSDIEFAINIETVNALQNFNDILSLKNINLLQGITFGRVDFTGSLNKNRDYVNSDTILDMCKFIFEKSKEKNLKTALGGAISNESQEFINILINENLLDKYETRKIVYSKEGIKTYKEGLLEGIKFELEWLKSKRRYYHLIAQEDENRIKMLEQRLNG